MTWHVATSVYMTIPSSLGHKADNLEIQAIGNSPIEINTIASVVQLNNSTRQHTYYYTSTSLDFFTTTASMVKMVHTKSNTLKKGTE